MKKSSDQILADNLRLLMLEQGTRYVDFGKTGSKITARHVRRTLNGEQTLTLEKLDALAEYFHVSPTDLITPNIQIKAITNGRLQSLIDAFLAIDSEGQDLLVTLAERETKLKD